MKVEDEGNGVIIGDDIRGEWWGELSEGASERGCEWGEYEIKKKSKVIGLYAGYTASASLAADNAGR